MNTAARRVGPNEQARIDDLMTLMPRGGASVLEIGARDCYITKLLALIYPAVTALDLKKPEITQRNVVPVQGDVTSLEFPDDSFEVVICTEVLEHVAPRLLQQACNEISRVAAAHVLVGVPYRQDIRAARTRCRSCGKRNPPFGHRSSFDEAKLRRLFGRLRIDRVSFVGETTERTNFLSAALWDLAGNPYGTYHQEEACGHCGAALQWPPNRTLFQKVVSKVSLWIERLQSPLVSSHPIWIHVLFQKPK